MAPHPPVSISEDTLMPKPEWGVKRTCPTTGQRFYDLKKTPIISPYTGEVVELTPTKATAAKAKPKAAPVQEEEALVDETDLEDTEDTSDDTLLDDDDDDDKATGPALSDEDSDDEPVKFQDDVLLDDDDDDDDDDIETIGDVTKPDDET